MMRPYNLVMTFLVHTSPKEYDEHDRFLAIIAGAVSSFPVLDACEVEIVDGALRQLKTGDYIGACTVINFIRGCVFPPSPPIAPH